MKFGGSSIADGERMLNVLEIVKKQKDKKIVVLSACQNITDKLENIAVFAKNKSRKDTQKMIDEVSSYHIDIINATIKNKKNIQAATKLINGYISELSNLIDGISLLNELTPAVMDSVFSFGELLSTALFHHLCLAHNVKNKLLDARQLIITDSTFNNASPIPNIYEKTTKGIIRNLSAEDVIITQGFIASDINSKTTTLGRGGSDLTAALIGAAINASEIQIWTDVNGILTADPKKNNDATTVAEMTFQEIKDLSFWGAKVLHPKTILPAIAKNITVKVLNSFNPTAPYTTITANSATKKLIVNSVIAKNNCYLFNMKSDTATTDTTSIYDYASITNLISCNEIRKEISVLYFGYNNGFFTILFEKNELKKDDESLEVENSFIKNVKPSQILLSKPVSVICISGQNFKSNPAEFTRFISTVSNHLEGFNLHQLIFQYSDSSIIFVVDVDQADEIVKKIHSLIAG